MKRIIDLEFFHNEKYFTGIISDANKLLDNIFIFNNPWDMECCHKPYKLIDINWVKSPNNDAEWVYMLNRFGYLDKLLIAHHITHDEAYLNKWLFFIEQWNNDNKNRFLEFYNEKKIQKKISGVIEKLNLHTTYSPIRALDTALRMIAIQDGLNYLESNLKIKKYEIDINLIIYNHKKYLLDSWEDWFEHSNWGLIIVLCILISELEYKNIDSPIYKWGIDKLRIMLNVQINSDGSHIEGSPMYHSQVFISLLRYIQGMKVNNYKIHDSIIQKTQNMYKYLKALETPDGFQPEYGDSDRTSLNTLLFLGSIILEINDRTLGQKNIDLMLLWSFRLYHIPILKANKKNTNLLESYLFKQDGLSIIKANNNYLLVSNGSCLSGHKHFDAGHFILYKNSFPIIVDSGRFTYEKSDKREYLRSSLAHNCVLLDGASGAKGNNTWNVSEYYLDQQTEILDSNTQLFKVISINYSGIHKKKLFRIHRYFFESISGITLIITQTIYPGTHTMEELFTMDSDCSVDITRNKSEVKIINKNNYNNKPIYLQILTPNNLKVKNTYLSKMYNQLTPTQQVISKQKFQNETISITMFSEKRIKYNFENNLKNSFLLKIKLSQNEFIDLIYDKNRYGIRHKQKINNQRVTKKLYLIYKKDEIEDEVVLSY